MKRTGHVIQNGIEHISKFDLEFDCSGPKSDFRILRFFVLLKLPFGGVDLGKSELFLLMLTCGRVRP